MTVMMMLMMPISTFIADCLPQTCPKAASLRRQHPGVGYAGDRLLSSSLMGLPRDDSEISAGVIEGCYTEGFCSHCGPGACKARVDVEVPAVADKSAVPDTAAAA